MPLSCHQNWADGPSLGEMWGTCEVPVPITIRPYRRVLVQCAVTYNAGPCIKRPLSTLCGHSTVIRNIQKQTFILDLSKIEAGKTELREEHVDVSRVLESCLTLVRERADEAGVDIDCDAPSQSLALYADERKFKQILINLLSNAIKFTPSGGKVTIRIWSRADAGYVFQITDTGIGIALADIPKVLTPFQQVDSALNRKYEGSGLGLPLTKALVELHGGSLGLQSEVGVGTTVTVRFPAERIVSKTANMSPAEQIRASAAE